MRRTSIIVVVSFLLVPLTPVAAHERHGRQIVLSAIPEPKGKSHCVNRGDAELYLLDPDGAGLRRLTRSRHDESHPSWSPSRRRIVFSQSAPGDFDQDLYVLRPNGTRRKLTSGPGRDFYPRWSPSGRWILFVRVHPTSRNASSGDDERSLMAIRADGRSLRRLTPPRLHRGGLSAGWGPEGRRIVFTSDGRPKVSTNLYVMGRRGRNVRRMTRVPYAEYSLPDWSPDGRWITYSSYAAYEHTVRRVRSNGRGRLRLAPRTLIDPHFSVWAPGGRRIAFIASRTGCRTHVYRMTRAGTRVTDLLKGRDLDVYSLDW